MCESKDVPTEPAWRLSAADCSFLCRHMLTGFAYGRVRFEAAHPSDLCFLDVNQAFGTQTGLKGVIGRWATEVLPGFWEANPEVLETFGRVVLGQQPERFETYLLSLGLWLSISVYSPEPEYFIAMFEDITERKRHEAQLEHQAHHDSLTQLPNRMLAGARAEHALARAKRRGGTVAVLVLDLDGFKYVNDAYGHQEGDQLLREAAQRLQGRVRGEDTLARMGGDEFLVVMEAPTRKNDAATLARGLNEVMRTPFVVRGRQGFVTTSIGIALYPQDGKDMHALFSHADVALYRAKRAGGDRFCFYQQNHFQRSAQPDCEMEWAAERTEGSAPNPSAASKPGE